MKRHRQALEVISSINITNMLDTALTLLIAFMIVAPSLKSGIQVDLPETNAGEPIEDSADNFVITIRPQDQESPYDRIYINKQRVRLENLGADLEALRAGHPGLTITVESDSQSLSGTLIKVMGKLHELDIDFALATEPESGAPAPREQDADDQT
ncbi:MAG: Biopolymer transport protein ExbD [candidate division BRC1 bacterium ADurb.BinA364]|nr:MAG: Biopolymer transport protein ExbD [candidate division BRC1 bacterium ADurb.BinA364]